MENETLAFEKQNFMNRSENVIDSDNEVMFTERLSEDELQNTHVMKHTHTGLFWYLCGDLYCLIDKSVIDMLHSQTQTHHD